MSQGARIAGVALDGAASALDALSDCADRHIATGR